MYHYDSRQLKKGDTFICLPGAEPYIEEALKKGVAEVLKMNREEMAIWADKQYQSPSKSLCVIGVTGTNGKTSVTQFVHKALLNLGKHSKVVGTLNSALTTPESLDLQKLMVAHLSDGGTHFVMEVSSHAIAQSRVKNIEFNVKCLTNLGKDHLDYHKTLEAYHGVKLDFMKEYPGKSIYPDDFLNIKLPFKTKLAAEFHIQNLKAAVQILRAIGISDEEIKRALKHVDAPEGRFEQIDIKSHGNIIIDYAHTPDGLLKVLKEAKQIKEKNKGVLRVVFGCGGERDRSKRPEMGGLAEAFADEIILTNDNPRSENEDQILDDICKGISRLEKVVKIKDRKSAIVEAIHRSKKEDVLVIAGKGHEKVQILAEGAIPFHDKTCVLESLKDNNGH